MYAAIASVPRAVGRIVVCVEEIAEIMTATTSTQPHEPSRPSLIARKKSSALSSLPSPVPVVPSPAYIMAATVTMTYVKSRMTVVSSAARPGMRLGSFVSSFSARHVSQPQ